MDNLIALSMKILKNKEEGIEQGNASWHITDNSKGKMLLRRGNTLFQSVENKGNPPLQRYSLFQSKESGKGKDTKGEPGENCIIG